MAHPKIKVLFFSFLVSVFPVNSAGASDSDYRPATFDNYVNAFFDLGVLDMNDIITFSEYMKVNYCDIYKEFSGNEFEWKEIHKQFLANQDKLKTKSMKVHKFIYPTSVLIEGYDFNTKSYIIKDPMKNVGIIELTDAHGSYCESSSGITTFFAGIPKTVSFLPERPVNLFRIPMSESLAENMYSQMRFVPNTRDRVVYLNLYITVRAVKNPYYVWSEKKVDLYGSVDKISFYLSPDRRNPFKALYLDY